ncbi:unnamed protein product [Euphydryas editha]|uniref:Uncharacterized protein n=1 Tax=Euphydryas editha TaxID=104508 RepID=A0AAU9U9T7_EUPED|nr:unnamed protein product [Euphydryas editha]
MKMKKARNKPADGGGHVNQKNAAGQKATPPCQKGGPKTPVKPSAQKGAAKTAPPKQAAAAGVKTPQGKKKKGHKHQQYELIVTINLVYAISSVLQSLSSVPLKGLNVFLLTYVISE